MWLCVILSMLSKFQSYRITSSLFSDVKTSCLRVAPRRVANSEAPLNISHCHFIRCTGFRGGAVCCGSMNVSVMLSTFEHNTANYGGGVFAGGIKQGTFNDLTFSNQIAHNLGAGIMLDSDILDFGVVHLNRVNFTHGTSKSVGALECWGGIQHVNSCVINNCSSQFAWPAVRLSSLNEASVLRDTIFTNNFSRQRGCCLGFHLAGTRAVVITCIFLNNRQLSTNGTTAYSQTARCSISFENCTIYGEKWRQFGGTKQEWTTWVVLTNTSFIYNETLDFGKDTPAPTATQYPHEGPLIANNYVHNTQ